MGYNVLASIIGLVAKLPDLPATHAHTDHLSVSQVLLSDGTIMSPPLVLMLIVVALLFGSRARQVWVARICTGLLILGVAVTAVDEAIGFSNRPALYSDAKWALAVAIGIAFLVVAVGVVVTGVMRLHVLSARKPIT